MALYTNGPYKQSNGTAITATSTNVDGGAIKMAGTSSTLRAVHPAMGDNEGPRVVAGVDLGQADWGPYVNATGGSGVGTGITNATGQYAGLVNVTRLAHGLVAGNVVSVRNNSTSQTYTGIYHGPHRVVAVPDANNFVLNTPYVYLATGVSFAAPVGNVANQVPRNYTMRQVAGYVHGVPETKMSSPASDYGRRKLHSVTAVRTSKVATSIRDGYWSPISGRFTVQPSQFNNFSAMGTDEVTQNNSTNYGTKGEFVYRFGGPSGVMGDYNGKTG